MGFFYPCDVYRNLCFVRGRHVRIRLLLLVTLTSWITSAASKDLQPNCSVSLTGSGIILSPNYPFNYSDNINCTWWLRSSSSSTSIRIEFKSFETESKYDVLRVYDEKGIVTSFSGNSLPPTRTLGKTARLVFTTDSSVNRTGFNASFTSFDIMNFTQCNTGDGYRCISNGMCISRSWRCDGQLDCYLGEDEDFCPATTTTISPQSECQRYGKFWCSRSVKCVPQSYRCDNYNDCTYGEDEANCPTTTISPQTECQRYGKFWCSRSVKCVPQSYKCDNYNDCTHGEDEANCQSALQQQCQQMQRFWCGTSKQCINSLWKCDQANDCTYGEDEQGCAYLSTGTITAIATGSVCGVVLLVLLIAGLARVRTIRLLRRANPTSNNYLQTTARPSATVWSTPPTYASQFGAPNRPASGPPGTGGLPMDRYAPPSYDTTIKAYATGQYAYPPVQSGVEHPSSNTPSTAPPMH